MMSIYTVDCPKCHKEVIELEFCGNNGYVGFCKNEKELLYYCSVLQTVTIFKPTGEHIDLNWNDLTRAES